MSATPGTGGRRHRVPRGSDAEATRVLRETLGEPEVHRHERIRYEIYDWADEGEGAMLIRLSSRDVKEGVTAWGQGERIAKMVDDHQLAPRKVLVALNCHAGVEHEQRLDWAYMRDWAQRGWLRWVALREPDRISRNDTAAAMFFRDLKTHELELWLASHGRQIDLDDPVEMLQVRTMMNFSSFERAQITTRTQAGIIRTWLAEGRGWPKQPKFGFRRDQHDYVEVDPASWPLLKEIHRAYATLDPLGGGSVRALRRHMRDNFGCTLGEAQLHRILRNPIYVTGEWTCTYKDVTYPCRDIKLDDPVDAELFARNQALLSAVRGKQRRTPVGFYALNGVRVLHRPCADDGRRDARHLLRGKSGAYRHVVAPDGTCRGFTVAREDLDGIVVEALLGLCESEEMQRAWATKPILEDRPATSTGENVEVLEADLRLRRGQLEEARRRWVDGSGAVPSVELLETFDRMTGVLEQEVRTLERRLSIAEKLRELDQDVRAEANRVELLEAARSVLTVEPPTDPDLAQRRVAFINASLDEVVVDVVDGELTVELRGPLIAKHAPIAADPLTLSSLGSKPADCLTSLCIGDSPHLKRSRDDCRHAWTSPLFRCEPTPRRSHQRRWFDRESNIVEVMRQASEATATAGRIPAARMAATDLAKRLDLSESAIKDTIIDVFGTFDRAWRHALGAEEALLRGRIGPADVSDWKTVVDELLAMGFRFNDGWHRLWDERSRDERWFPTAATLRSAERKLGFSAEDYGRAQVEHVSRARRRRRWPTPPNDIRTCMRVVEIADEREPLGRLTFATLEAVVRDRSDLPSIDTLKWRVYEREMDLRLLVIASLGVDHALDRGRVVPKTEDQWGRVVRRAVAAGLNLDNPWGSWRDLTEELPWLPSRDQLYVWLGKSGFTEFVRRHGSIA